MNEIKRITIFTGNGLTKSYEIGETIILNKYLVTRIVKSSIVNCNYYIKSHNKIIAEIINCPVEVIYE